MRSLSLAVVAALAIAACGGAGTPTPAATSPTAASPTADANKVTFSADLKAENEVPPISNDEKSASGKATVVLELTRDASGKITAAKASFDVQLSGFPSGAAPTLAHIHQAPAGQNGGVKVGIKTDADNPVQLSAGSGEIKKSGVDVDPAVAQAILDKPGDFYVNVHSRANQGGVVRGQLTKM